MGTMIFLTILTFLNAFFVYHIRDYGLSRGISPLYCDAISRYKTRSTVSSFRLFVFRTKKRGAARIARLRFRQKLPRKRRGLCESYP